MMKKYNVTVNGKTYNVEVEETETSYSAPSKQAAPVIPTPPVQNAPAPTANPPVDAKKETSSDTTVGKTEVKSPMAGTILRSLVSVGEKIEKNQGVMILEAMKMENEIVSPVSGVVATVNIKNGESVKTGDLLLSIN